MKDLKVFLDMDGVLVDLMKGLHDKAGLSYDVNQYPYPLNKYEMFPEFEARMGNGFSRADTYHLSSTREFWVNLPLERTAKELVNTLTHQVPIDNIWICSYPMAGPDTWAGKVEWINRNFPIFNKKIILCAAPKHFLAKPGTLLIDDRNENCFEFAKAGGSIFMIPQPWNVMHTEFNANWIPKLDQFLKTELNQSNS